MDASLTVLQQPPPTCDESHLGTYHDYLHLNDDACRFGFPRIYGLPSGELLSGRGYAFNGPTSVGAKGSKAYCCYRCIHMEPTHQRESVAESQQPCQLKWAQLFQFIVTDSIIVWRAFALWRNTWVRMALVVAMLASASASCSTVPRSDLRADFH